MTALGDEFRSGQAQVLSELAQLRKEVRVAASGRPSSEQEELALEERSGGNIAFTSFSSSGLAGLPDNLQQHCPEGAEKLLICLQSTRQANRAVEAIVRDLHARVRGSADPADSSFQKELRQALVAPTRSALQSLASATEAAQSAVTQLVETTAPESRAGYLNSLEELIGPAPVAKDWKQEELPGMLAEECMLRGQDYADVEQHYSLQAFAMKEFEGKWDDKQSMDTPQLKKDRFVESMGIADEDAQLVAALTDNKNYYAAPLARALRAKDPKYAGTTHHIYSILFNQVAEGRGEAPKVLYRNLHGTNSLVQVDPAWAAIEEADPTGFQGIVSTAIVKAGCGTRTLKHPEGFAPSPERVPINSDVVCFEISPPDAQGALHSPLMLSAGSGVFPPNTLFRLKKVIPAPFTAIDKTGGEHSINQRCLVVSATFQPLGSRTDTELCGKMSAGVTTLHYGSRNAYIYGVRDIIEKPVLAMQQEFQRNSTWVDWKGVKYILHEEWEYVVGPAVCRHGCTAGIRDANNHGFYPETFQSRINTHIRARRAEGYGLDLAPGYAELTILEVLAVRLYTGPAYAPLNLFMRQVALLQGDFRSAAYQNVDLTFSATVGHLCHAIRKICAVATLEETQQPLFRAVRGVLPRGFWNPEHGMVCATESAFMSTSKNRKTPISYMGPDNNVLWEMVPSSSSDGAYHYGADISMLSQYAEEAEVLFPPATMLMAMQTSKPRGTLESVSLTNWVGKVDVVEGTEEGKKFVAIRVIPNFQ